MCKNFKYFLSTEKLSEYISINIEANTNFANNTEPKILSTRERKSSS